MSTVDLIMPKLGESITEATILKWHKNPGDKVKMDETVLDIATDKVDSEVPSTAEGTIESILFKVNDVVTVGSVIARIKTSADESISATPILFHLFPPHHQIGHIRFCKTRDMRTGMFASHHVVGNQLSHPVHFNNLYVAGIGSELGAFRTFSK